MVDSSKCYILNPDYAFKGDIDRIMLYCVKNPIFGGSSEWLSIVHPDQAKILAYFTSNTPLRIKIKDLAKHFGKPSDEVEGLIYPYIDNPTPITTECQEELIRLPRRILIPMEEAMGVDSKIIYKFHSNDLESSEPYDLQTKRIKRAPHGILWMWTNRCGTRCQYCYADTLTTCSEMSTERMLELLSEAKNLKVEFNDIIGGEIFLRKDWDLLLKWMVKNEMSPKFISTKVPITEEIRQKLENTGFRGLIQISLDSLSDDSLKVMVGGGAGYVKKMQDGLERLRSLPVEIQVNSVLTKINANKETIEELFVYLNKFDRLKLWELRVPEASIYSNASFKNKMASRVDLENLREYVTTTLHPRSKIKIVFNDDVLNNTYRCAAADEKPFDTGYCGYLSERIFVLPDGKVTVCEQMYWQPQFIIGDLAVQTIEEVWNSPEAERLRSNSEDLYRSSSPCRRCDNFKVCNSLRRRCAVKVLKAYGKDKWDYPDPHCQFAPEFDRGLLYK